MLYIEVSISCYHNTLTVEILLIEVKHWLTIIYRWTKWWMNNKWPTCLQFSRLVSVYFLCWVLLCTFIVLKPEWIMPNLADLLLPNLGQSTSQGSYFSRKSLVLIQKCLYKCWLSECNSSISYPSFTDNSITWNIGHLSKRDKTNLLNEATQSDI